MECIAHLLLTATQHMTRVEHFAVRAALTVSVGQFINMRFHRVSRFVAAHKEVWYTISVCQASSYRVYREFNKEIRCHPQMACAAAQTSFMTFTEAKPERETTTGGQWNK